MKTNIQKDKIVHIKYTDEERDKAADFINKYNKGVDNLNRPLRAYDERTILEEAERNQKAFNTYIPPRTSDPDFDWMADTVRPITRNKIIAIATTMATRIIYPSFRAQNENDAIDVDVAEVARLISRWIVEHSQYELHYVRAVMNALTDPVSYMETGFYELYKNKKFRDVNGNIVLEKVIDEVMSGIKYRTLKVNEILFPSFNIQEIQEQPWLIKRKLVEYQTAKQRYGNHKNWNHVKAGYTTAYDIASQTFYEEKSTWSDDNEVIVSVYYNRVDNEEVTYVNNILMSSHEEPMSREDGLYPFAKMVFEEIQGLFTGKSAVNKIAPDQNLVDSLYNMLFDSGALAMVPPIISYGETRFDSSVMIPGNVVYGGEDGKVQVLNGNSDIGAGLRLAQNVEDSMSESTQSGRSVGIADSKEMTAVEFAGLEENSIKALGLFGIQLSSFVNQLGMLMIGDIKQYLTLPDINELLSDGQELKYRSFLANGNLQGGDADMNSVRFAGEMVGNDYLDTDEMSMRLLEEEGLKNKFSIKMVNPVMFRNHKFTVFISEEELNKPNKRLERALNLEAYDRAINNPVVDQEMITKKFLLGSYVPGEEDTYMRKEVSMPAQEVSTDGVTGNLTSQITGSNSLKSLLSGVSE